MTNQQILEKSIHQAVENGWDFGEHIQLNSDLEVVLARRGKTFFYDHDFAKAFWGEDDCYDGMSWQEYKDSDKQGVDCVAAWQYHLQQQVISADPIKYLERGIK